MFTKITRKPEHLHLSGEEMVDVTCEKLRELHEKMLPLKEELRKLDEEVNYWWRLKKQESLKLANIKKIPFGISGRPKSHSLKKLVLGVGLTEFLANLTVEQKVVILRKLNPPETWEIEEV